LNPTVDYDVEYNNRARVPEHPALFAGWAKDAAAYRARHAPSCISYGPGARNMVDFFPGDREGPIVVFIYGGYWQSLDGSSFSHLAGGLNAHGIGVAIPSYDLCPNVSVDDIIQQMRAASRELARLGRPLVISGHSAGGHLAACMLATDWPAFDTTLPEDLVVAAYAISGLFDLTPLVETSINKALRLDHAAARAASPAVLECALARKPRRGGRRKRKRGIFPAKQDHRRPLGRCRGHDSVRGGSRRQPFYRDCPAGGSGVADGPAPEGIGGALGFKKGWIARMVYCAKLL
jgi:arylformamidase